MASGSSTLTCKAGLVEERTVKLILQRWLMSKVHVRPVRTLSGSAVWACPVVAHTLLLVSIVYGLGLLNQ